MEWRLPKGYSERPPRFEDAQAVVDMLNCFWQWASGGNFTDLDEIKAEWQEPGFNIETDARVVSSPDGSLVAFAEMYKINALYVRLGSFVAVLPEHMGRGIEDYLMQWAINRAREDVQKAPEGARVVLHSSVTAACAPLRELRLRHGMKPVRNSYRMRIDFDAPPAAPQIPEGIHIRPIIAGQEEILAIRTAYDAFRDHWGFVEQPFEEYANLWMHHLKNDPDYDPSLYFIALDGQEIAGVSLCYPKIEETPGMAWVGTLGVLRPWRKRGLGLALLLHSFQEFYRRGIRCAGLSVDAENLTGALRLYEKAGMYVDRKYETFELELRPGKDLMVRSLE